MAPSRTFKASKTNKAVKALLAATYPNYNGNKVAVVFTERFVMWDLNWDGGTRSTYTFMKAGGDVAMLPVPAPWDHNLEGQMVEMTREFIVVQESYFCGKNSGIKIIAHPSYLDGMMNAKLIAAPAA